MSTECRYPVARCARLHATRTYAHTRKRGGSSHDNNKGRHNAANNPDNQHLTRVRNSRFEVDLSCSPLFEPGQHTATHCNAPRFTASHCNTLQHTATHCNTLQHTAAYCDTLQLWTHCNTLQHTTTQCNTLHHIIAHYITLQHSTTHYNTLQYIAKQCNTLQHTITHDITKIHAKKYRLELCCLKTIIMGFFDTTYIIFKQYSGNS